MRIALGLLLGAAVLLTLTNCNRADRRADMQCDTSDGQLQYNDVTIRPDGAFYEVTDPDGTHERVPAARCYVTYK
jgi:hypothetical protein